MNMPSEKKRLFFAFEVSAPWPSDLGQGRLIAEGDRHLTLAFLGLQNFAALQQNLDKLPLPPFDIGPVGTLNECLFLPPQKSRVVAYGLALNQKHSQLEYYQRKLCQALAELGLHFSEYPRYLPHVTLARAPFDAQIWKNSFVPLPCFLKNLHVYESAGALKYRPLWSYPLHPPFTEIDHTADVAYKIYGHDLAQIGLNAFWALFFQAPQMLAYWKEIPPYTSLDELIIALNRMISTVDAQEGLPLKAISFHGSLKSCQNGLEWEMIIDV